jgi:hypothetical protein
VGSPSDTLTYPDPPAELQGRRVGLRAALGVFGPGAIIASITIGSGETVFSARGGAVFGYAAIWLLVIGGTLKGAMIYATNRYITVTGEHPMTRWAYSIPGPNRWFPAFIGVVAIGSFPFWAGGLARIIGDYMSFLFHAGDGEVWATGFLVVCAALAFAGGYKALETAQTLIVALMLITVVVAVFWANPDWLGALYGFVPHQISYADWLTDKYPNIASRPLWVETVTYMGAIGGGIYDYIGYTGLLREKRWGMLGRSDAAEISERYEQLPAGSQLPLSENETEVAKAKAWSRAPFYDVLFSVIAILIFTAAFAINGANLLHERQLVPSEDQLLVNQANFLEVIHPTLLYLYYVAIFFAYFGTLYGLWDVYTSTTYETVSAVFPALRQRGRIALKRWVYLYIFVVSLALVWTGADPVAIVTPASIVGGVLGVGIFALAMLYSERKVLPPAYRLKGFGWWLTLIAGVVLTGFGIIAILQAVGILPAA